MSQAQPERRNPPRKAKRGTQKRSTLGSAGAASLGKGSRPGKRARGDGDLGDLPAPARAGITVPSGTGCFPGYDGGLNKPVFNSSGAPYQEPKSTENYFKRGGPSGFKAGKPTSIRAPFRPKSLAPGSEDVGSPKRARGSDKNAGPGFKPGGASSGLFSYVGGQGPADTSGLEKIPDRLKGGGLKVGAYKPKRTAPPDTFHAAKDFAFVVDKTTPSRVQTKAFKAGAPGRDFMDSAMLMSEPVGDIRDPPARPPVAGPWKPAGDNNKEPLGKFPAHEPDPWGLKPPVGAEGRHNGSMGVCYPVPGAGRTIKPIAWYKTRTGDVYRTRNLSEAAKKAGMPAGAKVSTSVSKLQGGGTIKTFDWTL